MVEVKTVAAVGAGAATALPIFYLLNNVSGGALGAKVIAELSVGHLAVAALAAAITFFGGRIHPLLSKFGMGMLAVMIGFMMSNTFDLGSIGAIQ